ncbi:MAG: type II toxin-antitoxin system RelE/ParE family toxin [Acidobacteriota bacterium]|nr:type II toxin-antitoxin system RelE/ParE family toxin [Acidobacteriota bacterium]
MEERPLAWLGTSLADVRAFPEEARRSAGFQLRRVQQGLMPTDWKIMSTVGSGVTEIRLRGQLEHRVLYIAKFDEAIYVLHAFEKKTQRTRKADLDLARRRLRDLEDLRRARKER